MECKAAGESVFAKEVLFEGNCEQAVDTELTLPDYCPDIGKLLKCRLVPMITSRQVNFDSLVVEGTARISVIYLDDRDKKLRCCDAHHNTGGFRGLGRKGSGRVRGRHTRVGLQRIPRDQRSGVLCADRL